ncbi:MAG: hypothetical protein IJL19_01240, partial [Clostridiales bacterium]|nr:hypothetical protein [Clostridiales bacterium]
RHIQHENITGSNIYQLLLTFDELYDEFNEAEKKDFMKSFVERIDIYPQKPENGCWIKNIVFNFPIPMNGEEITELPLESQKTAETIVVLKNRKKGDKNDDA